MWKTTLQLLLLQLWSTSFGLAKEQRVFNEGGDVVLLCYVKDTQLNNELFLWVKDGQKEVFLYDAGFHSTGQHPQFKGRVSHFEDELKHGNASIKISDIKLKDSGNYTCVFPHLQNQRFHIKLVVAFLQTHITVLKLTKEQVQLQCHVSSASPKPTVEWQDRTGKVLHTEEPQVSEAAGRFSVTLLITVTRSGHFRCVVTQEEIQHQVYTETYVYIGEELNWPSNWLVICSALGGLVLGVLITCLGLFFQKNIYSTAKKGSERNEDNSSNANSESSPSLCVHVPCYDNRNFRRSQLERV